MNIYEIIIRITVHFKNKSGSPPLSLTHCLFPTSLHQLLIVSFSIMLRVWANPIDSVVFCGELQAPVRGNTSLPWGDGIVPDYRHWHCLLPAWKWQELLLIACLPPPGTSLVSLCKKWVIIGFPVVIKYYHCSLWNAVKRDNKRLKGLEADLVLMLLKVCLLVNLLYVHPTFLGNPFSISSFCRSYMKHFRDIRKAWT